MSFCVIAVGSVLGSLRELKMLLNGLPMDFPVPVAVVRHCSYDDSETFASLLAEETQLPVIEVDDKEKIKDGQVYLCPSNYHMMVDGDHFALSTDSPVLQARPSIDVLFESAAECFREGVVGVLLMGVGKDGTAGLKRIKECGGYVVVLDPERAEAQTMARATIESMTIDKILPIEEIAPFLTALCAGQKAEV